MPTILKSVNATVTAAPTEADPGTFDAVVAVFGNTDSQNDIIDKGAFTDTLNEWAAKGQPIPIVWSHTWDDPFAHIGGVDPAKAQETDEGLLIKGSLDLENPTAAQVYKLMKSGRVNQFSFAATTADGGWTLTEGEDGNVVQHLTKLNLIEVGPTLRGANTETHLISIKSDGPTLKPVRKALGDTDPDDSIAGLAASMDAAIDQALALIANIDLSGLPTEVQQALALVGAADVVSDQLLAVLGIPDPDDVPDGDDTPAKSGLASVAKSGRILAAEHVETLKDIHGRIGNLIDAVTTTSRPSAGDEPAKSATAGTEPNEQPRQQAKARLAELATRKGQK